MAEPTCEVCGKSLEYSGRGRPPKRCAEHKNVQVEGGERSMKEGGSDAPRSRPRPRPVADREQNGKTESKSESKSESKMPPVGRPDTQSRAKAETAAKRTQEQETAESWPVGSKGRPMAKIIFSASELIPTGQYANVSVGPAQIHTFVDLDREIEDEEDYFTESERQALIKSMNELAEVVERDVVAVQRNLVLESVQEQIKNGN